MQRTEGHLDARVLLDVDVEVDGFLCEILSGICGLHFRCVALCLRVQSRNATKILSKARFDSCRRHPCVCLLFLRRHVRARTAWHPCPLFICEGLPRVCRHASTTSSSLSSPATSATSSRNSTSPSMPASLTAPGGEGREREAVIRLFEITEDETPHAQTIA